MSKAEKSPNFQIALSAPAARALSVVVFAALAAGFLAGAIWPDLDGPAFLVAGLARLAGLLGAVVLFLSGYGQQSQQPDSQLDERERDERNRAYMATHQIMLGLLFGFFIYATLARAAGWWLPQGEEAIDLLSAFAIWSMALPGAILAWRDRAPMEDG
jgi:hypothetical protein